MKIVFYHNYQPRKDVGFWSVNFNFLSVIISEGMFNLEILNFGIGFIYEN
jgi:hypothetical protein